MGNLNLLSNVDKGSNIFVTTAGGNMLSIARQGTTNNTVFIKMRVFQGIESVGEV